MDEYRVGDAKYTTYASFERQGNYSLVLSLADIGNIRWALQTMPRKDSLTKELAEDIDSLFVKESERLARLNYKF